MLIVDMPIHTQSIPCKHHATTGIAVEDRGISWKFFSKAQGKVKFGHFYFLIHFSSFLITSTSEE